MKIRIKKTRNKEFRFVLIGDNGEIIATSETYKREITMMETVFKYFHEFILENVKTKRVALKKKK